MQPYLNDESLSRGQVNAKVKEVAQAIESREGRKVEVIKRKIVVRPNIKGTWCWYTTWDRVCIGVVLFVCLFVCVYWWFCLCVCLFVCLSTLNQVTNLNFIQHLTKHLINVR